MCFCCVKIHLTFGYSGYSMGWCSCCIQKHCFWMAEKLWKSQTLCGIDHQPRPGSVVNFLRQNNYNVSSDVRRTFLSSLFLQQTVPDCAHHWPTSWAGRLATVCSLDSFKQIFGTDAVQSIIKHLVVDTFDSKNACQFKVFFRVKTEIVLLVQAVVWLIPKNWRHGFFLWRFFFELVKSLGVKF